MDYDAGEGVSLPGPLDDDPMWHMNFRANEGMEPGSYPERPGEQDCAYYIRTGLCKFGMTCRFNHPPNRNLAIAAAKMKGVYPERPGQPECQYYLRTGTCKFGPTCKFHHPRDKAGLSGRVLLNILGYPLRPNEMECAYYLRTGQCKFGSTCKFHHPQPSSPVPSLRSSPVYHAVHSSTSPGQQTTYQGGLANWTLSRASFIPSPRWQGPSNYAQLILPQGVVPVPSWNAAIAQGQLGSASPPEGQQQALSGGQFYGSPRQTEASSAGGAQGPVSSYGSGSLAMGLYTVQRDNIFPMRPDQPECQFYMKTGDCKFGALCKFHHPRERLIPVPNCVLSPMGLPLRPGEPLCIFYSRYGVCKFGPNCKFDHPMGTFAYGFNTSGQSDVPVVRRLLGSTTVNAAFSLPSGGSVESGSGSSRRLSASESRQRSSSNENIETEGSRTNTNIGPVSTFS